MIIAADSKILLAEEIFEKHGTVRLIPSGSVTRENIRDADILLARSDTKFDADLLEDTNVRFAATATAGIDHVDEEYLRNKGIRFAHAPGSNARSVADWWLAAVTAVAVKKNFSFEGKVLGVIGVGNVGSKIAALGAALGMHVLMNDPPLADAKHDPRYVPMEELADADIVTVHAPLTRSGKYPTYHLFDKRRFEIFKKGVWFVNSARGGIVETAALLNSIRSGHIGTLIADVWETEPKGDDGLFEASNLITPHIAGYSADSKLNATKLIYRSFCDWLGVEGSWDYGNPLPPPPSALLSVPEDDAATFEQRLYAILRNAYDVEAESKQFLASLATVESGRAFTSFRAAYPLRREFSSYTVRAGENDPLTPVLRAAMFKF